jgi:hypothetical protein
MARLGAFDVGYDYLAIFDDAYDPALTGWFDDDLLGPFPPQIITPPACKTDGDVIVQAPSPTLLQGANLAPSGAALTAHPVQADYLPTPSAALLIGAKLAAAGRILSAAPVADALLTPLPTITRVPTVVTTIPFVAPTPKADDIPPQFPHLLTGSILGSAGSIVAARPVQADPIPIVQPELLQGSMLGAVGQIIVSRPVQADPIPIPFPELLTGYFLAPAGRIVSAAPSADFLPTPLPVLTRAPTIVYPPIIVSAPPSADPMSPQFSKFLSGYTLVSGTILTSRPVQADPIAPVFPELLVGYSPPIAGTVIAHRPVRADDIPPQASMLRPGATLAAFGSILAPTPSADPIAPQRGAFLAGYTIAAGTIVAPYPVRADDIALVFPELIAGAKLTAAGNIIALRPVRADDSIPPQFSRLLAGFTLGTSGKIIAPSPTADFLPTPLPIFKLAPVIIYPTILTHPAPTADAMSPVFPRLLAGYKLTSAGTIVKANPVRADDVPLATTTLVKGFSKATGAILSPPQSADFLPTPTPELLVGYTIVSAGAIVAPYPIHADDIVPQFPTLLPALSGAKPLAAAGNIVTSQPIHADDITPQRSAIFQGFLPPAISFTTFRPVRADDIAPQFPHLLAGYTPLAPAGRIVTAYPVRADDIAPQKTSFITPVVYPPRFLISPRPVRADDIPPQFSTILRGALIGKAGFVVAPAPAAPFFPAPPATILIGSLPLPPAGSIVAFRPIRADDVPPQFPAVLRGYIYVPTPVGTSTETIFVDFPQLLWILEFEQSVCHIEYCDVVDVREVNERVQSSVTLTDMATIVDRKMYRGDTLFFLDALWQDVGTQQIFSIPVTDPLTPPPGNSVPYNLTGVHITVTIKNYVPDPDAAAIMQLDNQTLGGVSLISAVQGTFSVQGPAQATIGMDDSDIPLQLDIQIKTMAGAIFTVERGKLIIVPDITRLPN